MNPILGMGLKRAGLERRLQPRDEKADDESRDVLLATSRRFYAAELDPADDLGCRSRTFPCSHREGFLEAIGASEEQRTSLDGASLSLVISASFDSKVGRTCSLMAEWPSEGEPAVATRSEVFRFVAASQEHPVEQGALTVAGQYSAGCKQVEARSPEHADIAAIADFFLPIPA